MKFSVVLAFSLGHFIFRHAHVDTGMQTLLCMQMDLYCQQWLSCLGATMCVNREAQLLQHFVVILLKYLSFPGAIKLGENKKRLLKLYQGVCHAALIHSNRCGCHTLDWGPALLPQQETQSESTPGCVTQVFLCLCSFSYCVCNLSTKKEM